MRTVKYLCVLIILAAVPAYGQVCPIQAAAAAAAQNNGGNGNNSGGNGNLANFANPNRIVNVPQVAGFVNGPQLLAFAKKVEASDRALAIVLAPEKMKAADLGKLRMMTSHKALRSMIRVQLAKDESNAIVSTLLGTENASLTMPSVTVLSSDGHLLAQVTLDMGLREIDEKLELASALAIWHAKLSKKLDTAEKQITQRQRSAATIIIDMVEKEDIKITDRLAKLAVIAEAKVSNARALKEQAKENAEKQLADSDAAASFVPGDTKPQESTAGRFFATRIESFRQKLAEPLAASR